MSTTAFESLNNPIRSTGVAVACPPRYHRFTAADMCAFRPHVARSVTNSGGPGDDRLPDEICDSVAVVLIIGIQDTPGSGIQHVKIGRPYETWANIMAM